MSKENHRKKKEILMKRIKGGKYTPKRPTRNGEEKKEKENPSVISFTGPPTQPPSPAAELAHDFHCCVCVYLLFCLDVCFVIVSVLLFLNR